MFFEINTLSNKLSSSNGLKQCNHQRVSSKKNEVPLFERQQSKVIDFKTISKLQKFDKLSTIEKRKIQGIAKRIYNDKNALLALVGKKPSALVVVSEKDFQYIDKYKDILDSDKFKFVIQEIGSKNHSKTKRNTFIVNIPELKKVIDNNLEFFSYRLNEPDLTPEKAFDILTDRKSPLFDIRNHHDMVGICLGFPHQDSLLFNLRRDIANMIKDAENRNQKDTNAYKTLDLLYSILLPPLVDANYEQNSEKGNKVNKILKDWNLKRPQSNNTNHTGGYALITWDNGSKEIERIQNALCKGFEEIKNRFKNSGDILQLLLTS